MRARPYQHFTLFLSGTTAIESVLLFRLLPFAAAMRIRPPLLRLPLSLFVVGEDIGFEWLRPPCFIFRYLSGLRFFHGEGIDFSKIKYLTNEISVL